MDASTPSIASGSIMLWYGAIANIPSGWVLCDGTLNTSNLQNVFVIGAGDTYVVDAVGGGVSHTHFYNGDGHNDMLATGTGIAAGTDKAAITTLDSGGGETNSVVSLPPYRALAYIMKL